MGRALDLGRDPRMPIYAERLGKQSYLGSPGGFMACIDYGLENDAEVEHHIKLAREPVYIHKVSRRAM